MFTSDPLTFPLSGKQRSISYGRVQVECMEMSKPHKICSSLIPLDRDGRGRASESRNLP